MHCEETIAEVAQQCRNFAIVETMARSIIVSVRRSGTEESIMSVRVTFDVFSGRPNPTVVFEGGDSASLLDRLKPAMTSAGKPAETPPQSFLGYRGIVIEDLAAAKAGRPTQPFRVVDGKAFA